MEKISFEGVRVSTENLEKLGELFPQVMTEREDADGKLQRTVDFDALKELLGLSDDDETGERYQFTWPGKRQARVAALTPTSAVLKPQPNASINWETTKNVFVEGDNLEALKALRPMYAGKVKLIYIDPPYNTGEDFVYRDNFTESHEEYKASSDEFSDGVRLVKNVASNGRFHSAWCSMMYSRLTLARDFLTHDGVICVSIDDNEEKNLLHIMDELFGSKCFVANVSWQRTPTLRNDSTGIPKMVEHLVIYSKMPNWSPNRLPRSEEHDKGFKNPDNDVEPWAPKPAIAPDARHHQPMVYAVQNPFTGELQYPNNGNCWRLGQAGLFEALQEWAPYELRVLDDAEIRAKICGVGKDEVLQNVPAIMLVEDLATSQKLALERLAAGKWPIAYFAKNGEGRLSLKRYKSSAKGIIPSNLWLANEVGTNAGGRAELKNLFDSEVPFDAPKPTSLIRRLLKIATDKDSLVMDFFAGSGTTGEAVMRENAEDGGNRRFICVQIGEPIENGYETLSAVTRERLARAGSALMSDHEAQLQLEGQKPDVGFRSFELSTSNFVDLSRSPSEMVQGDLFSDIDNVRENTESVDLLFEILPQFGLTLSAKVELLSVLGYKVYSVDSGLLLAYFGENIELDFINELADMKPGYMVVRDSSFASDSSRVNFAEVFKVNTPMTICKVV